MKKIRLLADAHVFDNGFQGTTSFIRGLYNELVKNEELEIFLAARDIQGLKQYFKDERFRFIALNSAGRFHRLLFELPSIIRKHEIDFAHFQYIVPPIKRCRYIVTIHDLLFKDFPGEFPYAYRQQKDFLFKRAARKADILTTVSSYSAKAIERHYRIPANKIIKTPNAVDPEFFELHDKSESKSYIRSRYGIENFLLYVSRLEPRKNHELLIRSFHELRLNEQGLGLVFIGQESISSPKLESILGKLPVAAKERIHWLEKIPPGDLVHFYNAARIFLYPSRAEGFGIPSLEAAALQTPVLCSNATAMKDFDFFGESLFDPSDEQGFRKKLMERLISPQSKEELSAISQVIRKKYCWKYSADQLFQSIMRIENG